jgi:CHAD domain-containing protein
MAFCLQAGEPISDGITRILTEQVDLIIDNLTNPEIARDIGVHESRKTCKRIRATLRLVRDEIGESLFKQENIRFRDIARQLASARDSWVLVTSLDQMTTDHADQLPDGAYIAFRKVLSSQYEATLARERADDALIPQVLETLGSASTQIAQLPIQAEGFDALEGGLKRVYSLGRHAMKRSYAQPVPENFHEWRKRVKYLWHQVEILTPAQPAVLTHLAEEIHSLSDYLGDDHDLAVLRETALEYSEAFPSEADLDNLLDFIDQKRLALEAQAQPLGEHLYCETPGVFTRRLKAYWTAWQDEIELSEMSLGKTFPPDSN